MPIYQTARYQRCGGSNPVQHRALLRRREHQVLRRRAVPVPRARLPGHRARGRNLAGMAPVVCRPGALSGIGPITPAPSTFTTSTGSTESTRTSRRPRPPTGTPALSHEPRIAQLERTSSGGAAALPAAGRDHADESAPCSPGAARRDACARLGHRTDRLEVTQVPVVRREPARPRQIQLARLSTLAGRSRWRPAQNRPEEQGAFAFRSVSVHTEMVARRMSPNRAIHASGVRAVQGW